ncbi:MAG: hypothetical protein K8R36_15715, partial [Planctomycetales bacterium]|nr:hypothetical protein [Planctomycetales bacterium]
MHRSSKQRRSQLVRRWKRALFVAACAASFATSSFLFAEESAPVRKKLPIKSVTLPQMPMVSKEAAPGWWKDRPDPVVRQLAPIVRPEEAKRTVAKSETPAEPSSRRSSSESPAKLLGAKVSPFRPVAIEAVPSQAEEMRSDVIQPEEKQVVDSSSDSRPGQKSGELTPVELKGAGAEQQDVAAAPLSPWMQDVRAPQSEATTSQEDIAPAAPARLPKSGSSPFLPVAIQAAPDQTGDGEVKAAASAPLLIRLPAVPQPEVKAKPIPSKLQAVESQPEETLAPIVAASSVRRPGLKPVVQKPVEQSDAPAKLPTVGLSVFQRAATPAVSEVEVAGAETPVQTPEEPAEQARQQELAPAKLAPIVLTPKAEPLVQEAPEPGR